jgi:hypothetical protein
MTTKNPAVLKRKASIQLLTMNNLIIHALPRYSHTLLVVACSAVVFLYYTLRRKNPTLETPVFGRVGDQDFHAALTEGYFKVSLPLFFS